MIPPPRMTIRAGTFVWASRPVESTQSSESRPGIGGRIGNEPVATIAEVNSTSSPPSTAIVFASRNVPLPFTHWTPFALKSEATPPVICETTAAFHSFAAGKSSWGSPDRDAELAERVARLVQEVRRLHPGLGRDAADAQAGAAELRGLLDADHARTELSGPDRRCVPARPAAEDCHVALHIAMLARRCGSIVRRRPQTSAGGRPWRSALRRQNAS